MPTHTPSSEPFRLTAVEHAIKGTRFAQQLHHVPITSSTNDLALKAALAGARNGVWIADQQLAGRGRGNHTWHSPTGVGLYMTALVSPSIPMQAALTISLRVAIAIQSALCRLYGFARPTQADIRWPNDIMLNSRKAGGILIDTVSNPARAGQPATLRYAIVGIGVNLNQTSFPPDLEPIATSVRRELTTQPAAPLPREPLAAAILVALDAELRALAAGEQAPATCECPDPTDCSTWISGKHVRVEARDGRPGYTGTTAGLNPQGFLIVHGDDGQLHTVLSGGLREDAC